MILVFITGSAYITRTKYSTENPSPYLINIKVRVYNILLNTIKLSYNLKTLFNILYSYTISEILFPFPTSEQSRDTSTAIAIIAISAQGILKVAMEA